MMELLERSPFDLAEKRLVIIADWLPPDFGAVGQYMQLRAQTLAERGHDVTLVGLTSTSGSTVSEARGKGSLTEIRLQARPVPRASMAGRLLWTIRTNLRLLTVAFSRLRAADGILFTGSPPFLIHFLVPLKPLWRGRLIYRITDFHPECLIAAQPRSSWALNAMLALTNFWRRRVDGFEVLGQDQVRRLTETGIAADRMALVRDGSPVSFEAGGKAMAVPEELEGACVLLYAGNYGIAHEVETVAAGYERHHREGSGRVRLWLSATGEGPRRWPQDSRSSACHFTAHPRYRWISWPLYCAHRQPTWLLCVTLSWVLSCHRRSTPASGRVSPCFSSAVQIRMSTCSRAPLRPATGGSLAGMRLLLPARSKISPIGRRAIVKYLL